MAERALHLRLVPPLPPPAAPADDGALSALRSLPVLAGAADGVLRALVGRGAASLRELARDTVLDGPGGAICFVIRGQVALGLFDRAELARRRACRQRDAVAGEEEGSLLPPPPLAHVAAKNLALFLPGDHFNRGRLGAGGAGELVVPYSLSPAAVLLVDEEALGELAIAAPEVERALAASIARAQRRLGAVRGVKQEILDFYLRNGMSVAGPMVRVRQLDLCIDCMQCEEACEERHGARRLTLGGFHLGMLDVVYSCRSCSDARCLPPCEHDSIKRDARTGEIVIDHAKCIGCSLCSLSCPYGAIEMVNVAEPEQASFNPVFRARMVKAGALAHGPGTGRAAPARRLASKCDHCAGYAEQACVSACPTGALIEISPLAVFRERDQQPGRRPLEILPVEPFVTTGKVKDGGLARIRHRRMSAALWILGLLAWLAIAGEVALRRFAPELSVSFRLLVADGHDAGVALMNVSYLAGSELALTCGYLGTALLVLSMAYPIQRRFGWFRATASNTFWLDVHLMCGTVGPLFILLHSALRLDTWVSIPFWSMAMVVVSGVLGRYLYTLVPSLAHGHDLELLDHHGALAALEATHPAAAAAARRALEREAARARHAAREVGLSALLLWLLADDLGRRWRVRRCRAELAGVAPRAVARDAARRLGRVFLLERRRAIAPRGQLLLRGWKRIHVPFTLVLFVTMAAHIALAVEFAF